MDTPPGFAAYPNESSLDKGRHATDIADIFSMEAVDIERDIPRAHPGNPHRFTYMVEVPMLDSPGGISCDDNELDALFKAVGFVVVQWGQAEQSLDLTTAILYQDLEGRPLVKRLPKMLETKLEFVEKCLAKMPSLASVRADGEVLVADFRTLSAKRHDLIHGAIASVSATDGGFAFMKLDIQGDRHVVREFRFEGAEYPKLTKDLIDLGARATTFARKLWDLRKV